MDLGEIEISEMSELFSECGLEEVGKKEEEKEIQSR